MCAGLTQDGASLGNSIVILSGFPFPSAEFTTREGKPLIRIRDLMTGGTTETNFRTSFDSSYLIQRGDILIGMDGDFNVVRWPGAEALLNQRVCKVSANSPELDGQFLYWWLKPHVVAIHRRTPQTTVRHLSVGDIYGIPKPPLQRGAQQFAAAALNAVDEAITKTQAVIAKLKQLRAGLLHDLLTRGLDEHGQLRDPVAHPEQFQDSPLGRIPHGWKMRMLSDCVHSQITYGIVQAGPQVEGGVPYIRTGDMIGSDLRIDGLLRTSRDVAAAFQRSEVHTGEIVCAIRATLGKVLDVPPELDGANLTQGTARIAPKPELNSRFVLWALRSDSAQRQFTLQAKGTTFPEITLGNLRQLRIPLPQSRQEQDRIVEMIETQEEILRLAERELSKLQSLKSGLMNDLLTGRVRVPEGIAVTG